MKIASAEVVVTCPGRNFVSLRLETEDGVVGWGDATLNGRELAVVSYLRDHLNPILIGRDAAAIEDTWQYLYRGAYWRRGPVTMAAIAAVDVALWDIKAKCAGMPLYQLLGGASRRGLLAYGHASGGDLPALFDSIDRQLAGRLPGDPHPDRRPRARSGVRGGQRGATAGSAPTRAASPVAPAGRGVLGHAAPTCATCRACSRRCANEFGPELPLLHDGHHRHDPDPGGASSARALEPYDLFWLEDCTPGREPGRRCGWSASTPRRRWRIGEVFNTVWDYQTLITRAADRLRALGGHPHRRDHRAAQDPRLRRACTRSSRACTARPTSRRSAWPRRCTWGWRSTTSGSRSTCATAPQTLTVLPDQLPIRRRPAAPG